MSQSAHVTSIDALKDFRAALCRFEEDARHALASEDMSTRRAVDWLTRDRLAFWQGEVKRRNQELAQARTDLYRNKITRVSADTPVSAEKKEEVRVALARLREAEAKVERVRRWEPILHHALSEYRVRARPLADMLDGDLRHALALMDRMIAALEAYVAMAPPSGATAAGRNQEAGS